MITELDYLVLSALSYGDFKKEDIGMTLEEVMFINEKSKERLMSFPNEIWSYGGRDIFERTFHNFLCEWKVAEIMDETYSQGIEKTGFYAIAFEKRGHAVVSYRGTEMGSFGEAYKDFIETDLLIGMDRKPKQFEQGVKFYQKIREKKYDNVTLTGHSLGGGIAQYVALISDLEDDFIPKVFTWNAIGINKVGILGIDDFIKLDPLIEKKYPILLENEGNYKKIKSYYYTSLIRLLKKEGYIKGKENIREIPRSKFKLTIDLEIEKRFEDLLTINTKSILPFFAKKEEEKSRELILNPKVLLEDCFDQDKIYEDLIYARRFIKKFKKNNRYDDYIANFIHTEDFTVALYNHLGSTYAIDKGLTKINENIHPLLKKVYAFTKSMRNYHMYQVFLPFFILEGLDHGKITKSLNIDYIASEVRRVIYHEKNFTDEFLGFYYNNLELNEKNYHKIKKELLNSLDNSKANIKYLKDSIAEIKRMNYREFSTLWKKVLSKIGSPFVKKDIFDLIIFHERHK